MIITISGNPGAGKSTVAKAVAKKLGYKHFSGGDFRRAIAEERGISLAELNKQDEKTGETDKIADERLERLGKMEDNFVIDTRTGFHFIPNSFKVFLDARPEEGAKRIAAQARKDEKYKSEKYGIRKIKERIKSDSFRYKKLYGINYMDKKNYDLWIDTTKIAADRIVEKIMKELDANIFKK